MQTTTPDASPSLLSRAGMPELILCTIAILAYIGTLSFGFVYDDHPVIVENPALRSWANIPQSFVSRPAGDGGPGYYRPLSLVWLRTNYALFGLTPGMWHFALTALHAIATWLVFLIACRLLRDRGAAFVAGILFALHPIHIENVCWLSSAGDLLFSAFLLGSFLAFLRWLEHARKAYFCISLLLFVLALLTKETAVIFPALLFAYVWLMESVGSEKHAFAAGIAKAIKRSALYFCILVLYLGVRLHTVASSSSQNPSLTWKTMVLTWPSILWLDVRHLIWPVGLSEFYSVPYVQSWGAAFWTPATVLIALAVLAAILFRKLHNAPLAWFATIWIFLPLLPTLYLRALTPNDVVHDRHLYFGSVGFVIAIALLWRDWTSVKPALKWSVAALVSVACLAGVLTQQMQWASNLLLFERGVKSAPDNDNATDNLANELMGRGYLDRAIPLLLRVVERSPQFWRSNYNLGYAYYRAKDYPHAEEYLAKAIHLDPKDPDQYQIIAVVQFHEGKLGEAEYNARQAIERQPAGPAYHMILAIILQAQGNLQQAAAELQAELAYHPENIEAKAQLEKLLAASPAQPAPKAR